LFRRKAHVSTFKKGNLSITLGIDPSLPSIFRYSGVSTYNKYFRIAFANYGIKSVVLKKMPKKLLNLLQKGKSRPFVTDVLKATCLPFLAQGIAGGGVFCRPKNAKVTRRYLFENRRGCFKVQFSKSHLHFEWDIKTLYTLSL